MKKVHREEDIFEAIKKNTKIMEILGALKDFIPEAVVDVKERGKRSLDKRITKRIYGVVA